MNRQFAALLAVAVLAAVGGYFAAMHMSPQAKPAAVRQDVAPEDLLGRHRPDFAHRDLDGQLVSAADFDGVVWLVNFWASWCKPCLEEMPMLASLQDEYAGRGFSVVGPAVDRPDRARRFANDMGLSYPILVGEADMVVTGRRYGNATGMLPYSVLVDRQGVVRWSKLGALERTELEGKIRNLLGSD